MSIKKNKLLKQYLPKPVNLYLTDIKYHSVAIGIPTLFAAILQLLPYIRPFDINNTEYKKVLSGVMIFNIVMSIIILYNNKNFAKLARKDVVKALFIIIIFVAFPAVLLGLININKLSSNKNELSSTEIIVTSVGMLIQSLCIMIVSFFIL